MSAYSCTRDSAGVCYACYKRVCVRVRMRDFRASVSRKCVLRPLENIAQVASPVEARSRIAHYSPTALYTKSACNAEQSLRAAGRAQCLASCRINHSGFELDLLFWRRMILLEEWKRNRFCWINIWLVGVFTARLLGAQRDCIRTTPAPVAKCFCDLS